MARLLLQNRDWYVQVDPNSLSESDFETRVEVQAHDVYPEYFVFPFKQNVAFDDKIAKPDLVFISKDYSDWRVVEIEMGYHDLTDHVIPQVTILANGKYSKTHVDFIFRKSENCLDKTKLTNLMTVYPPKVLIILNEPKPEWQYELNGIHVDVAVFELFRKLTSSEGGEAKESSPDAFRINGEYPTLTSEPISKCRFHPISNRILIVENPNYLNLPVNESILIYYKNCASMWKRIDNSDQVFLFPENRNPLLSNKQYELRRQGNGYLVLVERD